MKFVPYGKNEFVPLKEPMTSNEQPNYPTVTYSGHTSTASTEGIDNGVYHRIPSLNETKYFLKTIRHVSKTTKLTTCTPFFIRRIYRTRPKSKEDFNFHNGDFTTKHPSSALVDNIPSETFKHHRGKIQNFFFHKTIEPVTEINDSTHTQLMENYNSSESTGKQITSEYDLYSNHYTVWNTASTSKINIIPAMENDRKKERFTCVASSKSPLANTTVACCADFTDRKSQFSISLAKLVHMQTDVRHQPGTNFNASYSPQFFHKILGVNRKNDTHKSKTLNNISHTFTSVDETVKVTPHFIINYTYYGGNKTLILFPTSFSPYAKIRLKNVLNFKDPSKPKPSRRKYRPILFKQNSLNRYDKQEAISSSNPLIFSNGNSTIQNKGYYNRPFDETPTSNSVTRVTKHCADSDFQTPETIHQGILIAPLQSVSHSKCFNISTLPSKVNEHNQNKDGVKQLTNATVVHFNISDNVFHTENLNSIKYIANKDITMQSNNGESYKDVRHTTRIPPYYGDVSNFNFKNVVNFKSRTTKSNEILVKTKRFYTARHPYIYDTTTPIYFPPVRFEALNSNLSKYNFENIVANDRDQEQKQKNHTVHNCTKYAYTLPTTLSEQCKNNPYSIECASNSNFESGISPNRGTNLTRATSMRLNLFNFKKPKSMFNQSDTTETPNNVTISEEENNKTVPFNFKFKNLFNNRNHANNIMSEYVIDGKSGYYKSSESTVPISQRVDTAAEKKMPVNMEGSAQNGYLTNSPMSSTTITSDRTNISYGFDPGGSDCNTSKIQSCSKSSRQKLTNDSASEMSNSSQIDRPIGALQQKTLNSTNSTMVQSNPKITKRINQWIFRHSKTISLFTSEPKRISSQFYKYVQSEEGNMFRWHKQSDNHASSLESSFTISSVYSSCFKNSTLYNEGNVTSLPQATKKRIKNMFNLNRPQKLSNVTTKSANFISSTNIVTSNLTPTENTTQSSSEGNTSSVEYREKSKTPKYHKKTRGNQVKIYKPFEKVLDKKGFTIKTEEIRPNLVKHLTNTMNKTGLMYNEYADYIDAHKKHRLEINNTSINNSTNNSDTSGGIFEFVFKPFSLLVNEFKSNSSKENLSDYNMPDIKNISISNPLGLNNSLVIIAAVNNATNTSAEEIHDSKVGWLDMLGGWFHCVVESFSEPKPQDIHFYLYTRNNSRDPEELLLQEQISTDDDNTTTEVPEPVFEQESTPEPAKKKKEVDEDYNFEPLNPAKSEIESKWFNVLAETKILIHGYVQDVHTNIMVNMKDAYLSKDAYNVIVLDWSVIGDNSCYPMVATRALRGVGVLLARLLDRLVEGGVSLRKVHVVGFSLGAHVAGHAGTELRSGLVSRITGLDPALPYVPMETDVSLDAGDAVFVDLIHSAAGYLGQPGPMGHVDFYPNGGSQQPGCDIASLGTCSHRRSALYFIESITSETGFLGTSCDSWHAFQAGVCANNTRLLMGEPCPAESSGKFYLTTESKEPFAQQVEEHAKVKKSLLLDLFYDNV